MKWAKGSMETIHGRIAVSWKRTEGEAVLDLVIPPNVTAEIEFAGRRHEAGSGSYHFDGVL